MLRSSPRATWGARFAISSWRATNDRIEEMPNGLAMGGSLGNTTVRQNWRRFRRTVVWTQRLNGSRPMRRQERTYLLIDELGHVIGGVPRDDAMFGIRRHFVPRFACKMCIRFHSSSRSCLWSNNFTTIVLCSTLPSRYL
jgi:hypothetical protein